MVKLGATAVGTINRFFNQFLVGPLMCSKRGAGRLNRPTPFINFEIDKDNFE